MSEDRSLSDVNNDDLFGDGIEVDTSNYEYGDSESPSALFDLTNSFDGVNIADDEDDDDILERVESVAIGEGEDDNDNPNDNALKVLEAISDSSSSSYDRILEASNFTSKFHFSNLGLGFRFGNALVGTSISSPPPLARENVKKARITTLIADLNNLVENSSDFESKATSIISDMINDDDFWKVLPTRFSAIATRIFLDKEEPQLSLGIVEHWKSNPSHFLSALDFIVRPIDSSVHAGAGSLGVDALLGLALGYFKTPEPKSTSSHLYSVSSSPSTPVELQNSSPKVKFTNSILKPDLSILGLSPSLINQNASSSSSPSIVIPTLLITGNSNPYELSSPFAVDKDMSKSSSADIILETGSSEVPPFSISRLTSFMDGEANSNPYSSKPSNSSSHPHHLPPLSEAVNISNAVTQADIASFLASLTDLASGVASYALVDSKSTIGDDDVAPSPSSESGEKSKGKLRPISPIFPRFDEELKALEILLGFLEVKGLGKSLAASFGSFFSKPTEEAVNELVIDGRRFPSIAEVEAAIEAERAAIKRSYRLTRLLCGRTTMSEDLIAHSPEVLARALITTFSSRTKGSFHHTCAVLQRLVQMQPVRLASALTKDSQRFIGSLLPYLHHAPVADTVIQLVLLNHLMSSHGGVGPFVTLQAASGAGGLGLGGRALPAFLAMGLGSQYSSSSTLNYEEPMPMYTSRGVTQPGLPQAKTDLARSLGSWNFLGVLLAHAYRPEFALLEGHVEAAAAVAKELLPLLASDSTYEPLISSCFGVGSGEIAVKGLISGAVSPKPHFDFFRPSSSTSTSTATPTSNMSAGKSSSAGAIADAPGTSVGESDSAAVQSTSEEMAAWFNAAVQGGVAPPRQTLCMGLLLCLTTLCLEITVPVPPQPGVGPSAVMMTKRAPNTLHSHWRSVICAVLGNGVPRLLQLLARMEFAIHSHVKLPRDSSGSMEGAPAGASKQPERLTNAEKYGTMLAVLEHVPRAGNFRQRRKSVINNANNEFYVTSYGSGNAVVGPAAGSDSSDISMNDPNGTVAGILSLLRSGSLEAMLSSGVLSARVAAAASASGQTTPAGASSPQAHKDKKDKKDKKNKSSEVQDSKDSKDLKDISKDPQALLKLLMEELEESILAVRNPSRHLIAPSPSTVGDNPVDGDEKKKRKKKKKKNKKKQGASESEIEVEAEAETENETETETEEHDGSEDEKDLDIPSSRSDSKDSPILQLEDKPSKAILPPVSLSTPSSRQLREIRSQFDFRHPGHEQSDQLGLYRLQAVQLLAVLSASPLQLGRGFVSPFFPAPAELTLNTMEASSESPSKRLDDVVPTTPSSSKNDTTGVNLDAQLSSVSTSDPGESATVTVTVAETSSSNSADIEKSSSPSSHLSQPSQSSQPSGKSKKKGKNKRKSKGKADAEEDEDLDSLISQFAAQDLNAPSSPETSTTGSTSSSPGTDSSAPSGSGNAVSSAVSSSSANEVITVRSALFDVLAAPALLVFPSSPGTAPLSCGITVSVPWSGPSGAPADIDDTSALARSYGGFKSLFSRTPSKEDKDREKTWCNAHSDSEADAASISSTCIGNASLKETSPHETSTVSIPPGAVPVNPTATGLCQYISQTGQWSTYDPLEALHSLIHWLYDHAHADMYHNAVRTILKNLSETEHKAACSLVALVLERALDASHSFENAKELSN